MAPDIEYFIRMRAGGGYGHTIPGAFLLSLPLGLIALWIFHRFIKRAIDLLVPSALGNRMLPWLGEFRFLPPLRFGIICVSMLIGIATHIAWDSFTHRRTWLYNHWQFLHGVVRLPFGRWEPWVGIFQIVSSIIGIVCLLVWFVHWYRATSPARRSTRVLHPILRWAVIVLMVAVALAAGYARGHFAIHHHSRSTRDVDDLITFFAVLWWQLALMGLFVGKSFGVPARKGAPAGP